MYPTLFAILCVVSLSANAQTALQPGAALHNRLTAYQPQSSHALAWSTQPAALRHTKNSAAGVYSERRFNLSELTLLQAAVAVPVEAGAFGAHLDYFGGPNHRSLNATFGYGRALGEKLSGGVQFSYFHTGIRGYQSGGALHFGGGLQYALNDAWTFGAAAQNPLRAAIGKGSGDRLPAQYSAGAGFHPESGFELGAEIIAETGRDPALLAGLGYRFDPRLWVRTGFHSGTTAFYVGAGTKLSHFRLEVYGSVHPQLGLTPGLQLLYTPEKQKP